MANTGFSQVGIGTITPNATLEIKSTNQAAPTSTDGVLFPVIDDFPLVSPTINQDGMLVYLTGNSSPSKGFYFWDNDILDWINVLGVEEINDLQDAKTATNGSSVFLGLNAGLSDNGANNSNVGIGFGVLTQNIGASFVTSVGYNSSFSTNPLFSSQKYSVSVGSESLYFNDRGNWNSAFGFRSLYKCTTASYNTSIGSISSYNNTRASYVVSVGFKSLYTTTNRNSVAVGANSLYNNSGSFNTAIGFYSFNTVFSNFSNSTAIGYNTAINDSNQLHLGNASITEIKGQVAFSTYSDGRIKDNVRENVIGLDFITKLRPVTYNFNVDRQNSIMGIKDESDYKNKYAIEKIEYSGFIAQEVEKAAKEVNYIFSGIKAPNKENELYGLSYSEFVVPLVKAVQEQQEVIKYLKALDIQKDSEITNLEKRIIAIENKI